MLRAILILFTLVTYLSAQTGTARLRGVVLDGSGAVVPTAQVTALHQETGLSRSMAANEYGQYSFEGMPLGPYSITVTAQGFKKFTTGNNVLKVGDVRLEAD